MKRRNFIIAAAGIISLPIIHYTWENLNTDPLKDPKYLSKFCSEEEIVKIGKNYLDRNPLDNPAKQLKKSLLSNSNGINFSGKNKNDQLEWLNKKIDEDFLENNLQICEGWIISRTEAQQCALFSLV